MAMAIAESMYSDNLSDGFEADEQGLHYYRRAKTIFAEAGMNLRKWTTNSATLQGNFEPVDQNEGQTKILGMLWDTGNDILQIASTSLLRFAETTELTKRIFCAIVAKVFDPLGFLEPYVIRGKMTVQELWKSGIKWEDVLPEQQMKVALSWMSEIVNIKELNINRRYFSCKVSQIKEAELHVFSDSSKKALGAVCYLRACEKSNYADKKENHTKA